MQKIAIVTTKNQVGFERLGISGIIKNTKKICHLSSLKYQKAGQAGFLMRNKTRKQ